MRINEEAQIIKDDSELGEHPFGECEISNFISFPNQVKISLSPEDETHQHNKTHRTDEVDQNLFPLLAHFQVLEEIEFVEQDEREEGWQHSPSKKGPAAN